MPPSADTLEKYAAVLLGALDSWNGPRAGQRIGYDGPKMARPLLEAIDEKAASIGCETIGIVRPDDMQERFILDGIDDGIDESFTRELRATRTADHFIQISSEHDTEARSRYDPERVTLWRQLRRPIVKALYDRSDAGELTYTIGVWGSESMAARVGLTHEQYWQEMINGCYLDAEDPSREWRRVAREVQGLADRLTALQIERLHIEAEDTALDVGVGPDRIWVGGSGQNVPSVEVFTTPRASATEGTAYFDVPSYKFGAPVHGLHVEFEGGQVQRFTAEKGSEAFKSALQTPGGDRLGEIAFVDGRFARIKRPLGHTLYDENMTGIRDGCMVGSCHAAFGFGYLKGIWGASDENRKDANRSGLHWDLVMSHDREVTAYLRDGTAKVIYKDGRFLI